MNTKTEINGLTRMKRIDLPKTTKISELSGDFIVLGQKTPIVNFDVGDVFEDLSIKSV